jgi:phenolic acid decarboxylase
MKLLITMLVISIYTTVLNASELSLPTQKLNGTDITYNYTSGRSYNVKFEEVGLSYRYLTGSKPDKWWGPFPYQAFEVENNVYLSSWFEKGYGDYVTLLINFNKNLLYGSAILSGKTVHFHGAKIVKINRK